MKITRSIVFACAALICAPAAYAHEFWIEPPEFQVENDAPFVADLRNGELFKGAAQTYFPDRNIRLDLAIDGRVLPIPGRLGDRPAIQLPRVGRDGLLILVHEAAPSTISYAEWDKFLKFVAHKDFSQAVATHEARGWAKENFKEVYTRHSKSLVAVGHGAGADMELGLVTEFVARDNPYAPDFDGTLDVSLLYQGAPRADAQIEVYERNEAGDVDVRVLRTDAQGNAAIPVTAGMEYLLDAVVLRVPEEASTVAEGPVWETLWASMTFAVPAAAE